MKFTTAVRLSLNNLMTKKGRTLLTSFAGSIGIIGIALILSLSHGMQSYINRVEEDTLSSYPLTIQEASIDVTSMLEAMMGNGEKEEHNEVEISYGSYVWEFLENGDVKVTGSVDGDFKWYNKGEKPTDYQTFVFDKNQMKLLMEFSDSSKSPIIYDVLELSDTEMILRNSAKWLNLGDGEVIITRTLTLKRIN